MGFDALVSAIAFAAFARAEWCDADLDVDIRPIVYGLASESRFTGSEDRNRDLGQSVAYHGRTVCRALI